MEMTLEMGRKHSNYSIIIDDKRALVELIGNIQTSFLFLPYSFNNQQTTEMKHMKLFALLSFLLVTTSLVAQKTFSEGTVSFELTEIASDNPQAAGQLEMMKGSTMKIYIKDGRQMTSMNMMNGMMQQNMILNSEKDSMLMLMDMMGKKIKVNMPVENPNPDNVETSIEYFEDETKNIAGYETYKAILTTKTDGKEMSMVAYITEDYKFDGNMIQNMEGSQELRGMPLEYTIEQPEISMTFTAQELLFSVDASVFDIDTTGYEEMSPEDLQNMGDGGMGF